MMRFLLVEAAQVTVRSQPEWRSKYLHLVLRRGRKIAKVAMARRLAVQLFWMLSKEWDYQQLNKFGSHAGEPGLASLGRMFVHRPDDDEMSCTKLLFASKVLNHPDVVG